MKKLLTLLAAITLASSALAEPRHCAGITYVHTQAGTWTIEIDAGGWATATDPSGRMHYGFLWADGSLDWDN